MSFRGVLEVVDRSGHVQSRTRIEALPFRIGRALDSDLVIDDPYVCPHHAEIRGEDTLEWVDAASLNGSFTGGARERVERIPLTGAAEIRLGHTHLRFRPADEALPATLPDPLAGSRWLGLDRIRFAAAAFGGSLVAVLVEQIIGSSQSLRAGVLLGSAAPALIVLALWALAWSLVNRVVAHRFHYFGHLAIAGFGVIAGSLLDTIGGYAAFAMASDQLLSAYSSLSGALLAAAVVFGHLRLISRGSAGRLVLPAALVGAAILSLGLLPGAGDDQFSSEPSFAGKLKPPFAALRTGRSAEQYYTDAQSVFDAADEAAAEADAER
ncbi:MAG: FHA domain-containing protein [Rhodanobacteraceae bacterium]|nr:FHA domain-containing protein [Rhodanobacteraceae bacterium]